VHLPLTEKEAGSDAANVQMASGGPSEDGSHFVLTVKSGYITNAAIADVADRMARTPVPGSDKTSVTAFLVTPDMPGFEMLEARCKDGNPRPRPLADSRCADVKVPKENISARWAKGSKSR